MLLFGNVQEYTNLVTDNGHIVRVFYRYSIAFCSPTKMLRLPGDNSDCLYE